MISKYFLWTSVLIVNILLFSSCLNSSDNNMEYPTDPQIYAISIASKADTTDLLTGIAFTIDQVNGKLFNKEPLPYQFHVDSVILRLTGSTSLSFSKVELTLDSESPYEWKQTDSIAISRLRTIKTTAPDGITTKEYDFQLNIYQEDPYILSWTKLGENYLTSPVTSQKSIIYKDRFFTYYLSGTDMKAKSTLVSSEGKEWSEVNLSGMPPTLRLSTVISTGNIIYALDASTNTVYRSTDGSDWSAVATETGYKVVAIYGGLPFSSGNLLLAVNHDGKLKFAKANDNLSKITPMNEIPDNMPVTDFSAIKVESSISYASKFIFLSGGTTAGNTANNDIWLLQEDENMIKYITSKRPTEGSLQGSSLFFYDDKPYLIAISEGKNVLLYSENYGVSWVKAIENQTLPSSFTGRTAASAMTDTDNYIWIFGGISSSNTPIVDIWRGRLNKFALN